jgi:hypothetical protein
MTIDKRINFRFGGAYQGGSGAPGSAEASSKKEKTNYTSENIDSKPVKGSDYKRSREEFIDKFNKDRARDFKPSFFNRNYKPIDSDEFGYRNQRSNSGLATLLGLVTGIPFGLFNRGKRGLTTLFSEGANKFNNMQGDFREKLLGYRTQDEYDNARQQRINLNRINTIQNTLNTKYADGDYSNTDLDERLAALRSQMGIVPNTAEQDAQKFLDFNNDLAINTEQSIIPNQDITTYKPDTGINTLRFATNKPLDTRYPAFNSLDTFPEFNSSNQIPILESSPQYASRQYPFFPYNESV